MVTASAVPVGTGTATRKSRGVDEAGQRGGSRLRGYTLFFRVIFLRPVDGVPMLRGKQLQGADHHMGNDDLQNNIYRRVQVQRWLTTGE